MSGEKPTRVLVTGGGTSTALSVLKGLARAPELPTWTCLADPAGFIPGRWMADAWVEIPPADDPGFVDALLDVCSRHWIDLLIPVFDPEFRRLAAAGVPVPRSLDAEEARALGDEDLPVFVKPRDGRGSQGARAVRARAELLAALDREPGLVVRELCGEPLPRVEVRAGVRMLRYWDEVFVDTGAEPPRLLPGPRLAHRPLD